MNTRRKETIKMNENKKPSAEGGLKRCGALACSNSAVATLETSHGEAFFHLCDKHVAELRKVLVLAAKFPEKF